jgi:hypothetical protein
VGAAKHASDELVDRLHLVVDERAVEITPDSAAAVGADR